MISKPDKKVMQAFAALRSNENFRVVTEYLNDCLLRTDIDGRSSVDEVKTRWRQGQAQDLAELISLIDLSKRL